MDTKYLYLVRTIINTGMNKSMLVAMFVAVIASAMLMSTVVTSDILAIKLRDRGTFNALDDLTSKDLGSADHSDKEETKG